MQKIILISKITCPECGFEKQESMPIDACLYYYQCTSCHSLIKPLAGDCCVFCSFGTLKCPPQQAGDCCL
ncbi:GDCCVxC domain-containing (seleno)protein [Psychromonas sp.]|uniref:GDCCVxC domain-containing (seleno)protein n=1 Tax=Psychromonas sp. TaxID=1884585 RepID=UPI0039E4A755